MGAKRISLLYYCNTHWFSHDNIIARVFEMRNKLYLFLEEEIHDCVENFIDNAFPIKMVYLSDIFQKFNSLNLPVQGTDNHVIELVDKITAFRKK